MHQRLGFATAVLIKLSRCSPDRFIFYPLSPNSPLARYNVFVYSFGGGHCFPVHRFWGFMSAGETRKAAETWPPKNFSSMNTKQTMKNYSGEILAAETGNQEYVYANSCWNMFFLEIRGVWDSFEFGFS